ncbi:MULTISPECIES: response regulator transcription factor [Calothrix]|uniref:Response regulator transcription factor n=2 Tax=Calothrix TaxID=1186 RepID=A0ABR8A209_9CYAN|nr:MULTISPECIES: response regulator transcription factor [Calothrix]MBD2193992.1 response regulator transcription factor [Calothrix parietina FACHB-288]MBD2222999.1 response regulator transcription factor [Calothrix anomala FACHB-343]
MIRVVVVATSPVVRVGLAAVVGSANSQLTVVGSAADLDSLTREIGELQPDVVLLDLGSNPQPSIWEKLLLIQEEQDSLEFLMIVEEPETIDLEAAISSGIRGILPGESTESEIIAGLIAIAQGLIVLHPDFLDLLSFREKVATTPVITLTPREIEVLEMLGSGLGNKAIAKQLQISEHTVKFHISSIFQKLAVSSRTEAVTVGVRLGLIML